MNELKIPVSAPDAKLWSVDDPNLYVCEVELSEGQNWWIKIPAVLDSVGSRLPV